MKPIYKVFVNGCFDLLHIGHVRFLQWAKEYGIKQSSLLTCKLIVGLNSDDSIIKLKGNSRPINRYVDRRDMLLALDCVDDVEIFHELTPEKLIQRLQPDLIVIGPDYIIENREDGIRVVKYPHKKRVSSSDLIERINEL